MSTSEQGMKRILDEKFPADVADISKEHFAKAYRKKQNPTAIWNLSLNVDCPQCGEYVNLLDDPDFFDGRELEPCETRTEHSRDVEVQCPNCEHEFVVDLEY